MRNPTLYRVGGNALVAGSVLLVVGMVMHPATGEARYEDLATPGLGLLELSHYVIFLGVFLLFTGWFSVLRHFLSGENEGIGTLAYGTGIIALSAMGISKGMESIGPLLVSAHLDMVSESAYQALVAVEAVLYTTGVVMAWVSAALASVGILRDSAWPRAMGLTGLVVSIASLVLPPLVGESVLSVVVTLVGLIWLAVVGVVYARIGKTAAERAVEGAAV